MIAGLNAKYKYRREFEPRATYFRWYVGGRIDPKTLMTVDQTEVVRVVCPTCNRMRDPEATCCGFKFRYQGGKNAHFRVEKVAE